MADDDGVTALSSRYYGQILEDAVGLDAVGQLGQVAQVFPGVVGMGVELFDGDIDQAAVGRVIIVIVTQRSKEGFIHPLPIPPVTDFLLVVDVIILARICGVVGTLQLGVDKVTPFPLAFDLQRAAVID